ncbi:hypothetical protein MidiMira_01 [Proteus phage MidiMira-UFV02]|nr:hypothetical protein BigMira_01 [Proteus phage BigMira-UFV01]WJJ57728.1 hypothetical protein MidiMira_01 [Proteus phage MidiMira-UFV02]
MNNLVTTLVNNLGQHSVTLVMYLGLLSVTLVKTQANL